MPANSTHGIQQRNVKNLCSSKGCVALNIVASSRRGVADLIVSYGVYMIYLEIKVGKDRVRPSQQSFAREVLSGDGIYMSLKLGKGLTQVDEFEEWLDRAISDPLSNWCWDTVPPVLHPVLQTPVEVDAIRL